MFNNRLKITADAFRKDITGVPAARYDVLLPSEVGYSLPNENLNKQAISVRRVCYMDRPYR